MWICHTATPRRARNSAKNRGMVATYRNVAAATRRRAEIGSSCVRDGLNRRLGTRSSRHHVTVGDESVELRARGANKASPAATWVAPHKGPDGPNKSTWAPSQAWRGQNSRLRHAGHAGRSRSHTRSASLRRSSFLRSLGSSSFLRSRIAFGVTSTSSSSAI
jgi:hypothetical protein